MREAGISTGVRGQRAAQLAFWHAGSVSAVSQIVSLTKAPDATSREPYAVVIAASYGPIVSTYQDAKLCQMP